MRCRVAALVVTMLSLPFLTHAAPATPAPIYLSVVRNISVSPSDLRIAELAYSGDDEVVTIENAGIKGISLGGYRLQSLVGNQWYAFTDVTLAPDQVLRVHSGPSTQLGSPQDVLWSTRNIWNDEGDRARLYDPVGRLVASYGY